MSKPTAKQRAKRADFLMNWFLSVFNGLKAPFPRKSLKGVAALMEEHLAGTNYRKPPRT